jgi:hypothetical protein
MPIKLRINKIGKVDDINKEIEDIDAFNDRLRSMIFNLDPESWIEPEKATDVVRILRHMGWDVNTTLMNIRNMLFEIRRDRFEDGTYNYDDWKKGR